MSFFFIDESTIKKAQIGFSSRKFFQINSVASIIIAIGLAIYTFLLFFKAETPLFYLIVTFVIAFFISYILINSIPRFAVKNKKIKLESDLLYSARHLLLKLQSGSSLINAIESVSMLKTNSGLYFKEIVFDISMGVPLEDALEKAIEYSPSKAYTKFVEEINNSLMTGADIQKALKATLEETTRQHLIQIQEYGRKLNPMTMFYMIIGTILPSLGTAMLVVATSLLQRRIIIDSTILLPLAFVLLVVQIFFILGFKSLKPAVME